ncbi:MAG: hypothetical protein ACKV2Q_22340 [Planctomycetaceae bacterium]
MTAIRGHWKQGRVVLDQPTPWAEGARLVILEANDAEAKANDDEIVGLTEDEQEDDPESIAKWIAEWDSIPPLEMSPEEKAEMWAWHQRVGDYTVEAIRQQWEKDGEA